MGRMAAHTGQVITYDHMLNCEHEFAPTVDKLTMDSPRPDRGQRRRQVSRCRSPASPPRTRIRVARGGGACSQKTAFPKNMQDAGSWLSASCIFYCFEVVRRWDG